MLQRTVRCPSTLRIPPDFVVWMYDTIDNNFEIENNFTNKFCLSTLRIPPDFVVWMYDTIDNNFEIENNFTKYLKESSRLCSD